MQKRVLKIIPLVALVLVSAASADYCFESRSWQEGKNATAAGNLLVEGCVDGDRFGVTIKESGNPFMREGHRIVAKDVTKEVFLVDPENETYSPWNVDAVLGAATTILKEMGPLLKIKVENVSMQTLDSGKATLLGRSVDWVKIEWSYDVIARIFGIKNRQHVAAVEELWIDHDLDLGFNAWFDRDPPDLGPEFNQLWELEKEKLSGGVALKTVRREISTGKKGKTVSDLKTINEMLELEKTSAPAGTYTWPDHYTLANTMPGPDQLAGGEPGSQQEEAGESGETKEEKRGWRSRLPLGKKKDG